MASYKYKHMSAQEFARNLDELDITLGQFCRITGMDYDTVRDGMLKSGNVPIPHHIRIIFAMGALPGSWEIARMMTDSVVEKASDFNADAKSRYGSGHAARENLEVETKAKKHLKKVDRDFK